MPRFDKTGPEGKGPLTGRGLGKCAEDVVKNVDDTAENIVKKILKE